MTEMTMSLESAMGLSMSIEQLSQKIKELGLPINLQKSIEKGPEFLLSEIDDHTGGDHELFELVVRACMDYDEFIDGFLG